MPRLNPKDQEKFRGETFGGYSFSFLDYDMGGADPHTWANGKAASSYISIQFQIHNKSSGSSEWLDASVSYNRYDSIPKRFVYDISVPIPLNVTTGAWNMSYYNWTFNVDDSLDEAVSSIRPQASYYFYNRTRFKIHNNLPVITNLDVSSPNIFRNNDIQITFNISDSEDPNPLTVVELNITGPQGTTNLSLADGDVSYASGGRKYVYTVNRSANIGLHYISLKVSDTDGRVIANTTTLFFDVKNNLPTVLAVNYTLNGTPWGNVMRDLSPPVNITVNITDIEDSWLDDNATRTVGGDAPYIELSHDTDYSTSVNIASPHLEPHRLNLTLVYAGNNTNGNVETWKTSMTFNYTINGTGWEEIWYAGELDVKLVVYDKDGGKNETSSTTHPSLIDTIIVLNNNITAFKDNSAAGFFVRCQHQYLNGIGI